MLMLVSISESWQRASARNAEEEPVFPRYFGNFFTPAAVQLGMIFLDNDDEWILARTREELFDILLARFDLDDDEALIRFAAACLGCDEDDVVWMEE